MLRINQDCLLQQETIHTKYFFFLLLFNLTNKVKQLVNLSFSFQNFQLIERAQEENRRLLSLLEDRDHKIMALEARLLQQQHEMTIERERLREENAALIRAMAALASN